MATKEPQSEAIYVEITNPSVDARFGKLAPGRIVPVSEAQATRWVTVGIAKPSSESAYNDQKEHQSEVGDKRVAALNALNGEASALWTPQYRDAVLADPENLQRAMDSGMTITNLDALVDDDGIPLDSTASHEDIMNARENIQHPDAGIDAHTSSSLTGNRSHYTEPVPERQRPQEATMSTASPNKRVGRITRAQVANAAEEAPRGQRVTTRTTGDTLGNVTQD